MHGTFAKKRADNIIVKAYNASKESYKILPDTVQAHKEFGTKKKTQHETTISLQLLSEFFRLYRLAHYGMDTRHKRITCY